MQKSLSAALLLSSTLAVVGCGASLDALNRLAASGSIHEDAPVTAHLQVQIAAPVAQVWALLIDARSWPKWNKQIERVAAPGPLGSGTRFTWTTGGTNIHSQVQLCEPEHRLSWTGTALTAKAIHVWVLEPKPGNQTMVTVKESMDGPWMAQLYPSQELATAGSKWLAALKQAAEQNGQP